MSDDKQGASVSEGQASRPVDESYVCGACGGTFLKTVSDKEALAEYDEVFSEPPADLAVICHDCWQEFMPWMRENHPEALR